MYISVAGMGGVKGIQREEFFGKFVSHMIDYTVELNSNQKFKNKYVCIHSKIIQGYFGFKK